MTQKSGTGDSFANIAVVVLAILLFGRTADVLRYFSPQIFNEIVGQDVSTIYGMVCAFFVEGVAITYHFNPRAREYTPAVIVKWILLGISGICQVFDGKIIIGTLSQMNDFQRLSFEIGVPLLPLILLVLIFSVGHLPDNQAANAPKTWRGLKNMLPDPRRIWEGDELSDNKENTVFSSHPNPAVPPAPKSDNGEHELDFPSRQRR